MPEEWRVIGRRVKRRVVRQPRIYASLNKRGEIFLSAGAFAAFGGANVALLMYDAESRKLAIRWPHRNYNFFYVRKRGRGGRARVIRAKQVFDELGIKLEGTLAFTNIAVEKCDDNPMLVLDLNTAVNLENANDQAAVVSQPSKVSTSPVM